MNEEKLTLEENVGEILIYVRRMYRRQVIIDVIRFIFFLVFVVIPLVAFYYWLKTDIGTIFGNLKEGSESMGKVNELLNNLPR